MKQRLITAAVLLCILVPVLIFSGTVLFPVVAGIFAFLAVWEMQGCLGTRQKWVISLPALLIATATPLFLLFNGIGEGLTVRALGTHARALYLLAMAAAFVFYLLYLLVVAVLGRRSFTVSEIAMSYFTTIYITLAFSAIPLIRFGLNGQYYYLLCFIGPWVTDSFAYLTGVFFGKHKLIPEISPKKTVEGAIGGTLFCALAFVIFGIVMAGITGRAPNYLVLSLLGIFVAVIAQFGDLFASLVKRERGIKDYSNIFPGHGGVMDRFDSVMAVAPLLLLACTLDSLLTYQLLL